MNWENEPDSLDMAVEINRARASLKAADKKLAKVMGHVTGYVVELEKENWALGQEIAELRKQLAWARDYIHVLESESKPAPPVTTIGPGTQFRLTPIEVEASA